MKKNNDAENGNNIEEMKEKLEVEKEDLEVLQPVSKDEQPREKKIVVPGEVITSERKKLGNNVFLSNGNIVSDSLGLLSESPDYVSVVPLQGAYLAKAGDIIVGIVTNERFAGYSVDVNSIYESFISKKEFRDSLMKGDIVSARVEYVNELNELDISNPRPFHGGEIVKVSPVKIPRIIGKNGSMLNVVKQFTNTNVLVGRNGYIWIKGGNTELALHVLKKIEAEAHLSNLTNKITEYLKNYKEN